MSSIYTIVRREREEIRRKILSEVMNEGDSLRVLFYDVVDWIQLV
jgi:hypothetical protein